MSAHSPSPTPSADGGSAYVWILDHILTYPAGYEIPLRTMYTLNSSPRAQPLPQKVSNQLANISQSSDLLTDPYPDMGSKQQQIDQHETAAEQFKSILMAQIAHLPSQPCSLPPSFITSFVRRCFHEELTMVDFPQALTGMDYLRDLDARRRRELAATLRRLGIDKNSLGADGEEKTSGNPEIAAWVKAADEKEKRVEALYTQVYIGLRRWTMINELSLIPFNKANCLAMLNTLFPPASPTAQPTRMLTPMMLHTQRAGFWRYIQSVEKNGIHILQNLMTQGCRVERGDESGWPSVREVLDNYLRVANSIIDECTTITGIESFGPAPETDDQRRNGRKVDSGVSFATDDRPSTSSSQRSQQKSLPHPPTPGKHSSTMEKIARELRKLRAAKQPEVEAAEEAKRAKAKSIKKMKSTSALGEFREKNRSFINIGGSKPPTPTFNLDEETRRRAILEATRAKEHPVVPTKVMSAEV
ncbi:MAG: hypothetical protein M1817_006696 [Caeruleum heppii]|nr:MAG: hypothetical protein M1817_006696 [Caeruleum heppii]